MDQQSRIVLIIAMAVVAIGGLTVIQQSHELKGWATGIAMFVIAVGFLFNAIKGVMTAPHHGGAKAQHH